MGYDLNNFWEHTKSQKITRSNYLCNFIVETIDNNPLIRRLLRYSTNNPLATKSKNKNGEVVLQPILKKSLTLDSDEGEKVLFNCAFNSDMKTEQKTDIYISNPQNVFRTDDMGDLSFIIDVVVSNSYDNVKNEDLNMELKRGKMICSIIDDMLDEYTLDDDKYSNVVGNVKFRLTGLKEERFAKNNDYIVYSMFYLVKASSRRTMKGNRLNE
ncbi:MULTISPECIES: hypothetical protein [unclassified Clostridium]|uniref:hypothetical protein n=1 Tax=unclassified Clostridium TaxID=2614128 RepID=UPI00207A53B7|nr:MULTISPECIES: hypothetical protein [unclassified Clostridium]